MSAIKRFCVGGQYSRTTMWRHGTSHGPTSLPTTFGALPCPTPAATSLTGPWWPSPSAWTTWWPPPPRAAGTGHRSATTWPTSYFTVWLPTCWWCTQGLFLFSRQKNIWAFCSIAKEILGNCNNTQPFRCYFTKKTWKFNNVWGNLLQSWVKMRKKNYLFQELPRFF